MSNKATKLHNKELARVRKIAKRLEGQGYVLNIGKDISNLSTRQLRNIHSGHDLVSRNIYHFGEEASEKLRKEQIRKKLRKLEKQASAEGYKIDRRMILAADNKLRNASISKLKKWGYISKRYERPASEYEERYEEEVDIDELLKRVYNNSGTNIPRANVYSGSDASIQIDILLSIAEYGDQYRGVLGRTDSDELINNNGRILEKWINQARMKHTDEEIVANIEKKWQGGIQEFAKDLERLVLAVYDKVYATWGSSPEEFKLMMREVEETLKMMA